MLVVGFLATKFVTRVRIKCHHASPVARKLAFTALHDPELPHILPQSRASNFSSLTQ